MGFLSRIAARAQVSRAIAIPKGVVRREPVNEEGPDMAPLRRTADDEDDAQMTRRIEEPDEAQPLRRQEEEEELHTLRRQPEDEEEQEEQMQAVRRAADDEDEQAQPLRRQDMQEEEELQTLRRASDRDDEEAQPMRRTVSAQDTGEDDETAQPLRRQTEEGEEEEEAVQAIRRQVEEKEEEVQTLRRAGPRPQNLGPDNSPFPEEMRDETEPSPLTALRRDPVGDAGGMVGAPALPPFDPGIGDGYGAAGAMPPQSAEFSRPSVQIDQLDVLISEPAASSGTGRATDHSRSIRARYLRRL